MPPANPIDRAIEHINAVRYHNHRKEDHSDIVSDGLFDDLKRSCTFIRQDYERGSIGKWLNVKSPSDRKRKIDLFIGERDSAQAADKPDIDRIRICCENKSVITAHRNVDARIDDLTKTLGSIHAARPEAIIIGTVLVGLSERFLNVPDRLRLLFQGSEDDFKRRMVPRLSSGDESLFAEFPKAVSLNKLRDAERTVRKLREELPLRRPGFTHEKAFDFILIVPVRIDNVHPASVARDNPFGIDIDGDYQRMLDTICAGYRARWHSMA